MNLSNVPRARRSVQMLSTAMLVLSGVLIPIALCTIWLALVVLDGDRFARTVTPVVDQPAVQVILADALNSSVQYSINQASNSSPTVRTMIAAAGGTETIFPELRLVIDQVVKTPEFRLLWTEVNRLAHVEVKRLLRGETFVAGVDDEELTLVFTDIQAALQLDPTTRIGRVLDAIPARIAPYINVLQQPAKIPAANFLVHHATLVALGVSLLSAVLFWLGLTLSQDRRRALILVGVFGLFSLLVAVLIREILTDTLGNLHGVEGELAQEYADNLTSSLESGLWLVAVTGAVVALLAWVWPKFSRHEPAA